MVDGCVFCVVQKSRNPAAEAAKKKAELERRLEDVSGKLGSKPKQKKGKVVAA